MNLPDYFKEVNDFRVEGRCLHPLGDILGLVLCGVLCDCDDFSEIEDFGLDRLDFLREEFGFVFPNGIPSGDTLDRVFRHLPPLELEDAFHLPFGYQACWETLEYRRKRTEGNDPRRKEVCLCSIGQPLAG